MDQHHSAGLSAAPGRSTPAMLRGSMVARPWRGFWGSLADRLLGRPSDIPAPVAHEPQAWERAAKLRRRVLMLLVLLSAAGATTLLSNMLPSDQTGLARGVQIGLYGLLFAWVSAGFYTAMMGFWVLWRGDKHAMSAASVGHAPIHRDARTAIVMPICNENVASVFAGLRATCESLAATGASSLFDVYVLSDTSDPEIRAAELAAWGQLRHECGSAGRIYYRWRQRRTKRKSGNVADFCRRFGRLYRYMVVLDADSVMSGDCLVKLVRLMEANPTAGILQTAPQACGLDTVHARSQQFSGRVAGRLFTAGMSYWQLGESHYWGHNAIIRIEPFMKHCSLAPLKGHGGLSGTLLSHDFVEAALMRRAGYHVWLVQDLHGSYEQQPPNLLEELQRDRRWCQGNLQNARLIAEPGLHGVHRAMLGTGAMAYLSAPLWLASVLVGAGLWLFGERPLGGGALPMEIAGLWLVTVLMLLLPRVMGVAVIVMSKQQHRYGGTRALIRGAVLEAGLSALQAPVRMLAHTIFVVVALTGLKLDWKSPPREANDIGWRDALHRFGPTTGVVAAGAAAVLALQPEITLWLAPMALPLMLAVPLTVLTSRSALGQRLLASRLLLIPEEHSAPQVLRRAWAYAKRAQPAPQWRDALTDPWLFDVVRGAMGPRNTSWGSRGKARKLMLSGLLANQDAEQLSAEHRMRLLSEPQSIVRVRDQLAAANANQMRASWRDGEEVEALRA
ncbi:MAG: glucans biosynthesis glucosyltransferase MdoH [Rhizobacter sp.]|nr:glucans biosynthesis glucosyltransferase MdoH [Rhizobacter sp.]